MAENDTPAKRLKWAREHHGGYKTPTDAARGRGWKTSTYLGHENGDRRLTEKAARKYGAAYRIPWNWLMDGGDLHVSKEPQKPTDLPVFVSYRSGEGDKELVEFLTNALYNPTDMPEGSPEEQAIFTLVRYLRRKEVKSK